MKKLLILLTLVLFSIGVNAQTEKPVKLTALKCQGITKAGEPCKSTFIMKDGYCKVHSPNSLRCGANTSSNKPCKMVINKAGDKCRFHQN